MSKISEVKFYNFRAFSGDKGFFDFTDSEGKPADFVCIYGQNGMGKTSFFDGIEWFSNGEIYKFEDKDIKKEMKKFKGAILRNRNSLGKKTAVSVKFSDGNSVKRTITQRVNSNNDYSKGTISPKKYKDIIMGKQILPHSKIDNFVYATKPIDKYKEWGSFWDTDGKQRKLFNNIYQLKKLCERKIQSLEQDFNNNREELNKLVIDDEIINQINDKITCYNSTEQIQVDNLKLIKKSKNNLLNMPTEREITIRKSKLISTLDVENTLKNKLDYLVNYYESYYKYQRKDLNQQYQNIKRDLNDILEIHYAGNIWYKEYLEYKNLVVNIKNTREQLELSRVSLEETVKSRKVIEVEANSYLRKVQDIDRESENLEKKSENIMRIQSVLLNLNKERINIEEQVEKLQSKNENYEKKYTALNNAIYIKEKENSFMKFCENIVQIEQIEKNFKNSYRDKFELINVKINEIDNQIVINENRYKESKTNYDNMEEIIIKIQSYIETKNTSICPVCRTKFDDTEKLLLRINLTEQQLYNKKLYDEWQKSLNEKSSLLEQQNILILEWNKACEILKTNLLGLKNANIIELATRKNRHSIIIKDISSFNIQISNFNDELKLFGLYEVYYNKITIKECISMVKQTYFKKLNLLNTNMEKKNNVEATVKIKIIEIENTLNTASQRYELFFKNEININLINKINKLNSSKDNKRTETWEDIENYYFQCKNKTENIKVLVDNVDCSIEKFNNIVHNENHIESEELKNMDITDSLQIKNFQKNVYVEYLIQVYNSYDIEYTSIISKIKNSKNILENLHFKIKILNDIASQFCITEYNDKYKLLLKNLEDIKSNIDKYSIGNDKIQKLFNVIKIDLESNIETVFGSKPMNQIYKIIEPHKEFESLKYEVDFNEDGLPELYIMGMNDEKQQEILPEYFFSSAQLNTVALSIFFGGALSFENVKIKTIFIDDPVGHYDDINVLAFVDLIRNIIGNSEWQIIISTHDETFYNLLKNKISNEYYNSKFLRFSSLGKIENDD